MHTTARLRTRASLLVLALLAAGLLAGCGLAVAPAPSGVRLLVTRGFGARIVQRRGGLHAEARESVLDLLARGASVHTASGHYRVAAISGLTATAAGGEDLRWVYYVNGVQAPAGPVVTHVHPGDHVWWDLHDVSEEGKTPAALVGAFPEPFLNGVGGKRLPVRVECTDVPGASCQEVLASLRAAGVPAAVDAVGSGGAPETLRVIVGPWERIGGDLEAQLITLGPRVSGVYARFTDGGSVLALLNQQGQTARTLGAGAGLIAATQATKEAPVWVVTGTDEAGVRLAAHAFNRPALENHFALALSGNAALALPLAASDAR
jgi:hypothetical protein